MAIEKTVIMNKTIVGKSNDKNVAGGSRVKAAFGEDSAFKVDQTILLDKTRDIAGGSDGRTGSRWEADHLDSNSLSESEALESSLNETHLL